MLNNDEVIIISRFDELLPRGEYELKLCSLLVDTNYEMSILPVNQEFSYPFLCNLLFKSNDRAYKLLYINSYDFAFIKDSYYINFENIYKTTNIEDIENIVKKMSVIRDLVLKFRTCLI